MKPWPVQPRGGFTAFNNEVVARALGLLTPEQFRLFVGLVYQAEFKREGSTSRDGRWRVEFGQALVSYDGLAAAYGMDLDVVRRALKRFEQVALATCSRAVAAIPGATGGATSPTIVTLGSWFGIGTSTCEATISAATTPATGPATSPATIQDRNTEQTRAAEAAAAQPRPERAYRLCDELRRELAHGKRTRLMKLKDAALLDQLESKLQQVGLARARAACLDRAREWPGGIEAIASFRFFTDLILELEDERPAVARSAEETTARFDALIAAKERKCELWAAVLRRTQSHIPDAYFAHMLESDASFDGVTLTLTAPSVHHVTMLKEYRSRFERLAADIADRSIAMEFVEAASQRAEAVGAV